MDRFNLILEQMKHQAVKAAVNPQGCLEGNINLFSVTLDDLTELNRIGLRFGVQGSANPR